MNKASDHNTADIGIDRLTYVRCKESEQEILDTGHYYTNYYLSVGGLS